MTTQTTSSVSTLGGSPLPLGYAADADDSRLFGLPVVVWLKIAVIALLMGALYWANLSRLWLKTNPFTGQGNWEHAIVIPLIGIYYLYVWRDQLLGHVKPDPDAHRWSLPGIWALLLGVPLLLALAIHPVLLAGPGGSAGQEGFDAASFLREFADGGLSKLLPVVAGVIAVAGAAAAYVYVKRQELTYPATQVWLDNVWHGLGAWLTAMTFFWGSFFFVVVLVPARFESVVRMAAYGIAVIGVAGLAHIAFWGKSKLWRQRYDAILANSSAWFGAFLMLWGILFSFWGIYPGQNDFFKDIGMVVALFGVVTLLAGWRVMKTAWFPVVFLFCAIPWPDQVYSWVAMPLQNFAAKIGVFALTITGVEAEKFGTKILFTGKDGKPEMLNVAEACAGLKSLMTFISVAGAVAFLSTRMLWQKLVIVASAVPIAILCNAGRVAGQGLLHRYVSPEWSQNFAHAFAGLVMLIPGFFLILLVCWVIDHLFVEEVDDEAVVRRNRPAAAPAAVAATAAPAPSVATIPEPAKANPAAKVIKIPRKDGPLSSAPSPASATAPAASPAPAKPVVRTAPATKPEAPAANAAKPAPARPAGVASVAPTTPATRPAGSPVGSTGAVVPGKPAPAKPSAAKPATGATAQPAVTAAKPAVTAAKPTVAAAKLAPAPAKPAVATAKPPVKPVTTSAPASAASPAAAPTPRTEGQS